MNKQLEEIKKALRACATETPTPEQKYPCTKCYLYPKSNAGRMSTGCTCFQHLALDTIDMLNEFQKYLDIGTIKQFTELAKKKGQLMPCALGDVVFHISKGVNGGKWMPITSHTITNIYLNFGKEPKFKLTDTYGTFLLSDFGKTIFLTEKAAQQAVEG